MNYEHVHAAIKNELNNPEKFTKLNRTADEQLLHVTDEVRTLAIFLEQKKIISGNDKTLITGLTDKNHPKLAPEYQPESPYAYPLFKIHKLTEPSRLVHASKFGPLYRMEKWASPHLTKISREFCKEEFILDTGNLIQNLKTLNEDRSLEGENVNLFTLDVQSLYPSIDPELAMKAIHEVLMKDETTDKNTKKAIEHFIKLSFENAYTLFLL